MQRLAVLPFENLSGDASLDWVGRALAGMVVEQASASVVVFPYRADDLRSARLNGASRVLQGYYTRSGAQLDIHGVIGNLGTRRNIGAISSRAPVDEALSSASQLMARAIDTRTRPFGTQNGAAIRAWGESLTTDDLGAKAQALERAIVADPNFGVAYTELARLHISRGEAARAADVLKRASDRLSQFTDLERAQLEFVQASFTQNETQLHTALIALSRLVSTDVQTLRALAQSELSARRFPTAVDLLKSAIAIEPDNAGLRNQLGYAESYRGNLEGARASLEQYRALQSNVADALDSLGEVSFFAGAFADAEKNFLEADRSNPGFLGGIELLKAAQSRYMQGNTAGAEQLFQQFDTLRRNGRDALADIRRAQWLFVTGKAAEARVLAQTAASNPNSEIAAYAQSHLSLWAIDAGDAAQAANWAARAVQSARSPSIGRLTAFCRYVASPETQSAEQVIPDRNLRDLAIGMAKLYSHEASQAVPVLKALYERSSPTGDGEIRTLYAWALSETGQREAARALLERYFIPLGSNDEAMLAALTYPRFLALRKALNASTGSTPVRQAE